MGSPVNTPQSSDTPTTVSNANTVKHEEKLVPSEGKESTVPARPHTTTNSTQSTNSNSRDFLRRSKLGMGPPSHTPHKSNTNPSNPASILPYPSILPRVDTNTPSPTNTFKKPSLPNSAQSKSTGSQPLLLTPAQQQILDQEHRKNISAFKKQERDTVVFAELDHLLDITAHEKTVVENYKNFLKNTPNTPLSEKQTTVKKFHEDMTILANKKARALGYVMEGHDISTRDYTNAIGKSQFSLTITQQPSETAVANRYLLPGPQLAIVPTIVPCKSTFVVCASLSYHGSNDEIVNTIDGKQEVLQGIKRVTVDSSNHVIFTKLKVMEVSSKHRHQPFSLVFTLEEYRNDGKKNILSSVRSAPFHVQSRPNKRKSTGSLPPAKRFFNPHQEELLTRQTSGVSTTSSLPNLPTIQNERDQRSVLTSSTGALSESNEGNDFNYIDITDLLVLPQKEAARRLGISESMLCKRFKECTRRKWPYRYLRKIDKVISMLEMQKNEGSDITPEDLQKLEKLTSERVECLKPVRIRITTYDKDTMGARTPQPSSPCEDTHDAVASLQTLSATKIEIPIKADNDIEMKEATPDTTEIMQMPEINAIQSPEKNQVEVSSEDANQSPTKKIVSFG